MKSKMNFNLLTVTGKVKPTSVEATCELHNMTAGNPQGVAAAKALGDMSHMTYMPFDPSGAFSGDLLFLDIWNNLEGLNQFFGDHQVQAGAEMMFASREGVVWSKLENYLHFNFPAPTGHNDRIVGMIRGTVKSIEEAEDIHNAAMEKRVAPARIDGLLSHEFYVRLAAPGSPEALEVLGLDIWSSAEGMGKHYMGPDYQNSGADKIFNAKPVSSVWAHPKGNWVEW